MGHFGENLKRLRDREGWSQEVFAAKAGVSRSIVQQAESQAEPEITRKTYLKLAAAFGFDGDRLDREWKGDARLVVTLRDDSGHEMILPAEVVNDFVARAEKAGKTPLDFFAQELFRLFKGRVEVRNRIKKRVRGATNTTTGPRYREEGGT